MGDEPPIFIALERISLLCRSSSFDPTIEGYAELLRNVHETLRSVENFLQRCSESPDGASTIAEPHVPVALTINGTTTAQSPNCSPDYQAPSSSGQDLPPLALNTEFDHWPVGPNGAYASTITPTSAFFDYARYATDQPMQRGGMDRQQEGEQDECGQQQEDQQPDQVTREEGNVAEALAGGEDVAQQDHGVETRRECDIQNARTESPVRVSRNNKEPPKSHDADAGVRSPCTVDKQTRKGHVFKLSQKEQNRTKSQRISRKRKRKRQQRERSQHSSAMDSKTWLDLDPIIGKVACPDQILQQLMERAGDYASDTSRMRYLTDLFFHFGGPHAFRQIRDAFSALCGPRRLDGATTGGRVRALAQFDHAHPFEQRAIQVGLCLDRASQIQIAHDRGDSYPDRAALRQMMGCAYPKLGVGSEEYEERKGQLQSALSDGHNWLVAQQRCPSALWMFPRNMSEKM